MPDRPASRFRGPPLSNYTTGKTACKKKCQLAVLAPQGFAEPVHQIEDLMNAYPETRAQS